MTISEAITARHSVRSYLNKPIPAETANSLQEEIDTCNKDGGLNIQLVMNEPKAFDGIMAHYGKFSGVQNYIALVGKKSAELDETLGYYGERIVLRAQTLGLNTCLVAMTFSKGTAKKHITLNVGEKLAIVIALGYGATQGAFHKTKPMEALCTSTKDMPLWFKAGMEAVMLAPTAMNQQKFCISLSEDNVKIENLGGPYSGIDLGIVKYNFEVGAGKDNFRWI